MKCFIFSPQGPPIVLFGAKEFITGLKYDSCDELDKDGSKTVCVDFVHVCVWFKKGIWVN